MRYRFRAQQQTVKIILVYSTLFLIAASWAQDIELEAYIPEEQAFDDDHALLDRLNQLAKNPLDLNRATETELAQLPWISPQSAAQIVAFRQKNGKFKKIEDISELGCLNPEALQYLSTFITIRSEQKIPSIKLETRQKISKKLKPSYGFQTGAYKGNAFKLYNRIRGYIGNLSVGVLTEKDPGEIKWNDHVATSLALDLPFYHSKILIGHFIVEHAQGLLFWSPYRTGPGISTMHIPKPRGLEPFLSACEYSGFTGAAFSSRVGPLDILGFVHSNKIDASVEQDTITSLPKTGLHRNENEMLKQKRIRHAGRGLILRYKLWSPLKISMAWHKSAWSHPFESNVKSREQFNHGYSLSADYTQHPFYIATETAIRHKKVASAAVLGYQNQHFEAVVVCRNYSDHFSNECGTAFGVRSETIDNERGIYWGFKWSPQRGTIFSLWSDFFRQPMPTVRIPMPRYRANWQTCLQKKMKTVHLTARAGFKEEELFDQYADQWGNQEKKMLHQRKIQCRLQLDIFPKRNINLRSRFEYHYSGRNHWTLNTTEKLKPGFLLTQAMQLKSTHYSIWFQFTAFDALDYENRFYQFERDLPGTMCIKLLYGRGIRFYTRIRLSWKKNFLFTLKFENTFYDHSDTIGSGYDKIESSSLSALSLQLDLRFKN